MYDFNKLGWIKSGSFVTQVQPFCGFREHIHKSDYMV